MSENKQQHRIFEHINDVDISEQDIWDYEPDVLRQLLIDHTMSAKIRKENNDPDLFANIFWATNDYESRGDGYKYKDQITPEAITGEDNMRVIMPRVLKDKQLQQDRTKDKAEVFTPSWVCNAQNNLVDEAWFGRKNVFNTEITDEEGKHSWTTTEGKIVFPEGDKNKTWKKYVTDNRMEITCGEAPYLVSRYDTTTGDSIPLNERIGLLDRKLRVINENTTTTTEWLEMAKKAYQHTYGYEWQGDNLLLAREALLYTYIEYFKAKFPDETLKKSSIIGIARIISWNIWQMDGIKMVVPDTCHEKVTVQPGVQTDMFAEVEPEPIITRTPCPGCVKGGYWGHNGVYCLIRDWNKGKPKDWKPKEGEDPKSSPWQKILFRSLLSPNASAEKDEEEDDNDEEK